MKKTEKNSSGRNCSISLYVSWTAPPTAKSSTASVENTVYSGFCWSPTVGNCRRIGRAFTGSSGSNDLDISQESWEKRHDSSQQERTGPQSRGSFSSGCGQRGSSQTPRPYPWKISGNQPVFYHGRSRRAPSFVKCVANLPEIIQNLSIISHCEINEMC